MMSGGLTASRQPSAVVCAAAPPFCYVSSRASRDHPSNIKPFSSTSHKLPRLNFTCNCATGDSGENESKTILDAFFLGKAVAEALTERVESAVGEFLSTIGRLQAEQQKQVLEFQEDVLEKARRAKELAARETMEAQGLTPKSAAGDKISTVNGVAINAPSSVSDSGTSTDSSFLESKPTGEEDPLNDDSDYQ